MERSMRCFGGDTAWSLVELPLRALIYPLYRPVISVVVKNLIEATFQKTHDRRNSDAPNQACVFLSNVVFEVSGVALVTCTVVA